jgi:hypothetical protein
MTKAPARAAPRGAVVTSRRETPNLDAHLAAKAAEASPAPEYPGGDDFDAFIEALNSGIELRIEQAKARAEIARLAWEDAVKVVRKLEAIQSAENFTLEPPPHDLRTSGTRKARAAGEGSARAPRGDVPKAVLDLLADIPAGLPAGSIIDRLQADDKMKTSIRNFLAASKKKGTLRYNETTKAYAKA